MKKLSYLLVLAVTILFTACNSQKQEYLDWAVKIANSQMVHDPELWQSDGLKAPKWDYTQGLIARSMLEAYKATGDQAYIDYVQPFADYFILPDGTIRTYKKEQFNIDRVNGGTFLLIMNELFPEERYQAAMDSLYSQLQDQPRTSEGGFWHKKIYPWQMWLDGLYMGEPFYCAYARAHNINEAFADIQLQFETVDRHTYNPESGLNYHGWDESREQLWADSITGCSPHYWGRAQGWYLMAMVDVLDNMPAEHPGYASILSMLQRSAENIRRYQDPETHLWWQVLDHQGDTDNYLEATCSAMFCYAFAKGANKGYLPKEYTTYAQEVFHGLIDNLVVFNEENQTYDLTQCCAVAGLGGNPYRDASYEYYVHERIIANDPKGVGPFILAALQLAK